MNDPEIKAMSTIASALDALDEEQRQNVLLYINTRYGGSSLPVRRTAGGDPGVATRLQHFESIGDFFDAANPETETDRVVVVGYWVQLVEKNDDFESAQVSTHLKHLGHAVSNVTRAFDVAMRQSPRLVIQTSKSGPAKQARKRYKVTRAGVKRVERMIEQGGDIDDAE